MTNLTHGWTVSAKDRQFSIATVSHFGCGLTFADIGTLLAGNHEACKGVLENVATAVAQELGNNHPLVIGLETLVGTQFPPPIPVEGPVDRTVNPAIDPLDDFDGGSNDSWPGPDDR